jgi:hypothetical protein
MKERLKKEYTRRLRMILKSKMNAKNEITAIGALAIPVLRYSFGIINPLSPELNPICYLLALLAHDFLHVSRIRFKSLTLRPLMSYIYMEHLFLMFLDHT